MLDFEFLKQSASVLADAAVKTTKDLTDKGKHKMDVLAAQRHLAKTQRPVGIWFRLCKKTENRTTSW